MIHRFVCIPQCAWGPTPTRFTLAALAGALRACRLASLGGLRGPVLPPVDPPPPARDVHQAWGPGRPLCTLAALGGACAIAAACSLPFLDERESVRVLVYNIHAGKDASGQPNLEAVARIVDEHDADVVLLQEVDRGTKRSGGVDQLRVLMERTRLGGVFGRTLDYDGGQYGIAALSRGGFGFDEPVPLHVTPPAARAGGSHEPRGALVALAYTRLGRWQAITTHLDASADDGYRLQEAERLRELVRIRRAAGTPLMLGGDMNATPDSMVIRHLLAFGLRDAWVECGKGDGFTFPAAEPVKRIDYLFLDGALRCTSAEVIDTQASDHRPVLVTVVRGS